MPEPALSTMNWNARVLSSENKIIGIKWRHATDDRDRQNGVNVNMHKFLVIIQLNFSLPSIYSHSREFQVEFLLKIECFQQF